MSLYRVALGLACWAAALLAQPQATRQDRVGLARFHADAITAATGAQLVSGVPAPFSLPKGNGLSFANGSLGFQVVIPNGSTTLQIQLVTTTPNVDVDLWVRFGQDVDIAANGMPLADYLSEGLTGNETLLITTGSTPPLQAGTYYIGFAVYNPVAVSGTITATVGNTANPPTPAPVVYDYQTDWNVYAGAMASFLQTFQFSGTGSYLTSKFAGKQVNWQGTVYANPPSGLPGEVQMSMPPVQLKLANNATGVLTTVFLHPKATDAASWDPQAVPKGKTISFRATLGGGASGDPSSFQDFTFVTISGVAIAYVNAFNAELVVQPPITPPAALTVTSRHSGNFVQGQPTAVYTLSVQNTGAQATSGTVSVTDTLPSGLTATAISGPGWTCTPGTVACSRFDALAAGATYPPITVTVSVASNAISPVTNQVSASGGGSATATASDSTTIVPAFTDIPASDSSFVPFIDLLQQSGITKGCQASPPMYCSSDPIPESQMAVFVIRSVMGSDNFAYTQTPYFTDVPASNLYFPWIQKMQDLGIAQPCAQALYCPDSAVTRGIMSVLIIRSRFGVATPTNYPSTPYFTDVPASHPYFAWIQKMKQLGITAGCTPTTYCPDVPVTRGQMAVFIMRGEFNQGLQDPTTPVLVWVNPASASAGQTVTVMIVGQNTNFSGASQVSAGPGVTVSNVNVANGTTLTAQLTVAGGAVLGPRSITVTTGSEEATLPNGFHVQ